MPKALPRPDWWREAIGYQLYPRSFQDSNGDGVGDIPGIIFRLDYLNDGTTNSLGVDLLWVSPMYPSPMCDFGYDVADYCGVDPLFGTLDDMDRLIGECHHRGIRLFLDFVPNHTSDQHPWFIESRLSRTSPKRDWYVWRDLRPDGSLPNNWLSNFGGPAWTLDPLTGQCYLHSFLSSQPDLNWRNPEVVAAMHEALRFWLRRGVDGFRIDVMGKVLKHPELADNPPNPEWRNGDDERFRYLTTNNLNHPDVMQAVRGIRSVLDEFGAVAVGEVFGDGSELAPYYGEHNDGLQLAFDFRFIRDGEGPYSGWDAGRFRSILDDSQCHLPPGALAAWAFDNLDRYRLVTRLNSDGNGHLRGRAATLLLLGLPGVPFIYYGSELGMANVDVPEELQQDPARFQYEGRDPERSPMPWDESPGRGFTSGTPWLPFGEAAVNVANQSADPDSMLNLHRRGAWLRKGLPALSRGDYHLLDSPPDVFAFIRSDGAGQRVVVVVNTGSVEQKLTLPSAGEVILATDRSLEGLLPDACLRIPPLGATWVRV